MNDVISVFSETLVSIFANDSIRSLFIIIFSFSIISSTFSLMFRLISGGPSSSFVFFDFIEAIIEAIRFRDNFVCDYENCVDCENCKDCDYNHNCSNCMCNHNDMLYLCKKCIYHDNQNRLNDENDLSGNL